MTVYNFNAGPAILPRAVLVQAQAEMLDYAGTGMSVLEISHRSKQYEAINAEAEARTKRLLGLGADYRVLFMQGGASTQFALLPLNFLAPGATADYVISGAWGEKAYEDAQQVGRAHIAASTRASDYRRVPRADELDLSDDAAYVHITSNETIQGTQMHTFPDVGARPLIADMSSDILARPFDAAKFALIYAGAQKNIGPAGLTVVIVRADFLARAATALPAMLRYATQARNNSLYNTPPVFAVYLTNMVLGWIEAQGGLAAVGARNAAKATTVYDALDTSGGFYRGHAEPDSRSQMNVTFRLPEVALEQEFVAEATAAGMVGLAGHRSIGGIRASLYNAMDLAGCTVLAQFMGEFLRRHG